MCSNYWSINEIEIKRYEALEPIDKTSVPEQNL